MSASEPVLPRPPQPLPGSPSTFRVLLDSPLSTQDMQYAREILEFSRSFPHRSLCAVTSFEERSGPNQGFSVTHLAGSLTSMDQQIASSPHCVWYAQELVAELDSLIDLLVQAQLQNIAHRAISLPRLLCNSQLCISISAFGLEQKPPRDALFYPEASWNRYQSDVYALGVAFLLIAFNGREEIKRTLGTAEVAEVVEALGGGAEELKKRLRIMLGVTGERLDFVGLEEVVTGRKRQPPLPKPAPALLPKPSIVLPPKSSFIPFKPSIKKERPSVLPAPPQPLVPAKPSLLPANNDVPQALIPPKPAMNPLVQGIAKPGPEAGQPTSVPSANNESKSAEPRAGLPLTLPKMNFGPQDKLETVPKALGAEAKPGSLPVKPGLPPAPKLGQPFQPLKKPAEGGNDSPVPVNPLSIPKIVPGEEAKPGSLPVKPGLPPFPYGQPSQPLKKPEEGGNDSPANPPLANPLTIPKIGPPKAPVPASPYSVPKTCAKCKSPLSGDVCLICTAVKSNSPAEAPPMSGPFPPKQGTAGIPVPGGNRVPAVAPVPQPHPKSGQRDLITKATAVKECTCKKCGSQFRKKFSASPDYDQQFEDFCSEDCAFAYAASQ